MQRTREEINSQYRGKMLALADAPPKAQWTGDKNENLAMAAVCTVKKKNGEEFVPSEQVKDLVTAIFNPDRPTRMGLLKAYLEREGADVDPTTESLLEVGLDLNQIKEILTHTANPETDQPLIRKKARPNRKKVLAAALSRKSI